MSTQNPIPDPAERIEQWNGTVRKIWIDELPHDDEFVDSENPHYTGPYTTDEQRQLEEYGTSALQVDDSEWPTILRVVYVRAELAESVEDEIQVFVTTYDDGRKKDRLHFARGVNFEDVLRREAESDTFAQPITNFDARDGVELIHIGSFAEYRENADDYEFEFTGGTTVPNELMSAVGPHTLSEIKERASA